MVYGRNIYLSTASKNNAIQLRAVINVAISVQVLLRRWKITKEFCCNYDNWRVIFNVIRSLYVLRYKYILY
jgi:predicted aspartyl protease